MKTIFESIRAYLVLALLTGLIYPALVTAAAQGVFPSQANGSLIVKGGKVVGSRLLGQEFSDAKYFWGRISATSPQPYNGGSSGASNFSVANPDLVKEVSGRVKALRDADPGNSAPVPTDLATSSGSGLDPHISPAAAEFQVARVAKARNMKEEDVRSLVRKATSGPTLGMFGEPVVNVLELNLSLDKVD